MKITVVIAMLLVWPLAAEDGKPELKSRIRFEKGVSESSLEGWEKDFFKTSGIMEIMPEDTDVEEIPDIDTAKKIIKVNHSKKRTVVRAQNKIEDPAPQENSGTQKDAVPQLHEKIEKKPQIEKSEPDDKIEKTEEIPDNVEDDVDRSGRMRKMKELLKKRKGKGGIEDRRVY